MKVTDKIQITNENNFEFLKNQKEESICLTVTSPPYNLGAKHHTRSKVFSAYNTYIDDLPEEQYQQIQINTLNELFRVTKKGGSLMYNHWRADQYEIKSDIIYAAVPENQIVQTHY